MCSAFLFLANWSKQTKENTKKHQSSGLALCCCTLFSQQVGDLQPCCTAHSEFCIENVFKYLWNYSPFLLASWRLVLFHQKNEQNNWMLTFSCNLILFYTIGYTEKYPYTEELWKIKEDWIKCCASTVSPRASGFLWLL